MPKDLRRALYLDGRTVVEEANVVRFAVGVDSQSIRSQIWTFFGSANKPDFYFTSSLNSKDQKGSIHPTRAQFGFTSQASPQSFEKWMGVQPPSRHLETLDIPKLDDRSHLHVFTIRLPGIGLRKAGQPARRPKPLVLIEPFGPDVCVSLNLVLYQGDWADFVAPMAGQKAIAAIPNSSGRCLIIFMQREREGDPATFYRKFLAPIHLPDVSDAIGDDLIFFGTHKRAPGQPIVFTELHNVSGPVPLPL